MQTLEELGFTREEILDRVVDTAVTRLLEGKLEYDDGVGETALAAELRAAIVERIDEDVARLADEHVLPRVTELIESITLQATNEWGEKKGDALTFTEYLVDRARAYLAEPVGYDGEPPRGSYRNNPTQTRVAHMVHEHLQYNIDKAMKEAIKSLNQSFVDGLEKTVRMKLEEAVASLKVNVKV